MIRQTTAYRTISWEELESFVDVIGFKLTRDNIKSIKAQSTRATIPVHMIAAKFRLGIDAPNSTMVDITNHLSNADAVIFEYFRGESFFSFNKPKYSAEVIESEENAEPTLIIFPWER